MPEIFKESEWKMIYSNLEHGASMTGMIRKIKNYAPIIIIIKDENHCKFGAYCSESIRDNFIGSEYYGSGECFLYTFRVNNRLSLTIKLTLRILMKFYLSIGQKRMIILC